MGKENGKAIPTQEEYIAEQIEAKRKAALDKSRNRTSIRVPMISNELSYEEKRKLLAKNIKYLEEQLSADIAKGVRMDHPDIQDMIKELNDLVERYYRKKENNLEPGPNCMYNAGDCYGLNIPSNLTFAAKHRQLGFKKASKGSMEPGDIVQYIPYQRPAHAMIYDGKDNKGNLLFNYAKGITGADAFDMDKNYVKQGKYPRPIEAFDVYKYVGTPQDSTRWINEYRQIYGFGKGGMIGIPKYQGGTPEGGVQQSSTWTSEYISPFGNKKVRPIKEQEELIIGKKQKEGLKRFDKGFKTLWGIARLYPGTALSTDIVDMLIGLKEHDQNSVYTNAAGAHSRAYEWAGQVGQEQTSNNKKHQSVIARQRQEHIRRRRAKYAPFLGKYFKWAFMLPDLIDDSKDLYNNVTE